MSKEILKKVLNNESMELSAVEIENLLNEELEKSPEEMDTDLVDICIEALSDLTAKTKDSEANEEANKTTGSSDAKTHRIKPIKKILLIAAIVTVISVISISVSANVFKIDLPNGIARIYNDYISLDLTNSKINNLNYELEKLHIDDADILPVFYENNCEISSINNNDNYTQINYSFLDHFIDGYITIHKTNTYNSSLKNFNLYSDVEQLQYYSTGKFDIIVSSACDSYIAVYYNSNNKNYLIQFNTTNLEKVLELLNID